MRTLAGAAPSSFEAVEGRVLPQLPPPLGDRPDPDCPLPGPGAAADPELLREAFRWSCSPKVSRTATVSLLGNRYQVDPAPGRPPGRAPLRPRGPPASPSTSRAGWSAGPSPSDSADTSIPRFPRQPRHRPSRAGTDYLGLVLNAQEEATREGVAFRDLDRIAAREGA
jgi:hypothetical protein